MKKFDGKTKDLNELQLKRLVWDVTKRLKSGANFESSGESYVDRLYDIATSAIYSWTDIKALSESAKHDLDEMFPLLIDNVGGSLTVRWDKFIGIFFMSI